MNFYQWERQSKKDCRDIGEQYSLLFSDEHHLNYKKKVVCKSKKGSNKPYIPTDGWIFWCQMKKYPGMKIPSYAIN